MTLARAQIGAHASFIPKSWRARPTCLARYPTYAGAQYRAWQRLRGERQPLREPQRAGFCVLRFTANDATYEFLAYSALENGETLDQGSLVEASQPSAM